MNLIEITGSAAFVMTVSFASFGISAQILKNYRRKSTEGLSLFTFFMQLTCFFLWSFYGLLKKDYYILGSNFPGFLFVLILVFQFWIYRKGVISRP